MAECLSVYMALPCAANRLQQMHSMQDGIVLVLQLLWGCYCFCGVFMLNDWILQITALFILWCSDCRDLLLSFVHRSRVGTSDQAPLGAMFPTGIPASFGQSNRLKPSYCLSEQHCSRRLRRRTVATSEGFTAQTSSWSFLEEYFLHKKGCFPRDAFGFTCLICHPVYWLDLIFGLMELLLSVKSVYAG